MKSKSGFLKVGDTLTVKGTISFPYLITSINYNSKGEAVLYELRNCKSQHLIPFESRAAVVAPIRPILCSLEAILKAFDDVYRFSIFGAQEGSADRRLFLIEKSNLVNCGKSSII